ncbi:MAG: response regulator [Candidatus Saccharimonadales bacterium]
MKKVLIIEDEKPLRYVYSLILKKEGFQVVTAKNGKAGIVKLKSFKPDLIILDMLMPEMDGISFLKTARLSLNYPETRTIVVSNLSNPISPKDSKKFGVVHSFIKVNLSPSDLAAVVKKYTT